ncbi:hypothetical protein EJ08DRAFT_673741 [Tothia fuscella]|uniref:Uncharacterized protein n=1 Tax=Tothia fuscella TaxID=1048955 RepID=A0A9P4TRF7_9PEZI|nr:hypothetical protein EJ08DRAFT_673741 [Tothia fuscella]
MTVETETVSSIPQSTLGAPSDRVASGRAEVGGTLRVKASNETIRPGKGRKKASRKALSINATSASTRADIFEDRVKNAMDEATSDDSDETFVYESNPPEPPVRRSRHHSRTPSGASVTSQQDQRLPHRSIQNALSTPKTRSMKFANAHSSGADEEALERQDGTIRASNTRNGTSSIQHHHLSRPNRNGTGHTSILDDDNSPFFHLNKTRSLTGMPGRQSQNARFAARSLQVSNGTSRKGDGYSSYDMDAEGGDDERTPLMGTVRTPRSARRSTLQTARVRYPDHYPPHRRSMLSRFAGFIVLVIMLLLLAFGVVGFLFAISTPLADASILEIQAVLASEQEIMFDLVVEAINPNLLPINIADMDINVFAKSKYVGSAKWWREHENDTMPDREKGSRRRSRVLRLDEYPGVGRYEDFEDDDPKGNRQTMLLGRVDHFDNPLTFDGSFWKRHPHFSTGSLRLSKPGNRTELGGTERWERVLLHPFELIVRGTLKYKIPLGGRAYAANVGANATVKPEESGVDTPIDDGGRITG